MWLLLAGLSLLSSSVLGDITVKALCETNLNLYADTTLIGTHSGTGSVGTFTIPDDASLVAIECSSSTDQGGILASFSNEYMTDGTWECSNTYQAGWTSRDFDSSTWLRAHVIDTNEASTTAPWGEKSAIEYDAKWIWTQSWSYGDATVYCRGKMGTYFDVPDNAGKEFLFGYMENHGSSDPPLELYVTTVRPYPVSVRLSTPAYSSSIDERFTVSAGQVEQVLLDQNLRHVETELTNKAIRLTATDEVVMYAVNKQLYSNDAFVGIPVNTLGTEYRAVCYTPQSLYCLILLVCVEDNTDVDVEFHDTVDFRYNGQRYDAGDTFQITLNRYDTLQMHTETGDFTGTLITSSKPLAIISGNRRTNIDGASRDHLTEMLPPIDTWGTDFVAVPIPNRPYYDPYKFVASEAGTTIQITGKSDVYLAQAGDFAQVNLEYTSIRRITADKPILTIQYQISLQSGESVGDPSMQIIPPTELFGSDFTFSTPQYGGGGSYDNYLTIIVKESEVGGVLLNEQAVGTNGWSDVPDTSPKLVTKDIYVLDGIHRIRHQMTNVNLGVYLYGFASYETYACSAGSRLAPINSDTGCQITTGYTGDGIDNDCDGLIDEELCIDSYAGADEDGDGVNDEDCAVPSPINGAWSDWGSWGSCLQCGTSSTQVRERLCDDPLPQYNGLSCSGDGTESQSCNVACTPVDGGWGAWASWGACSVTCGLGSRSRSRSCNDPVPLYGGAACAGSRTESEDCQDQVCPVDGGWGTWSSWSSCSVTCEGSGVQTRSRSCDNPVPVGTGAACVGSSSEQIACDNTAVNCPVDGNWGAWSSWSTCSVTCEGSGVQSRSRSCDDPAPAYNGSDCTGAADEQQACDTSSTTCPVNGSWSTWSSWSTCSVTCEGSGVQSRSRSCNDPTPAGTGSNCTGVTDEQQACDFTSTICPVNGNWGAWSSWSACSVTCEGSGVQSRSRSCDDPAPLGTGSNCTGVADEQQACDFTSTTCPVNGNWGAWSSWSTCSVTCEGSGVQSRSRSCDDPAPAGTGSNCTGVADEQQACDFTSTTCPVNGNWGAWSSWSSCTVTCEGSGVQSRSRSCDNPAPAGTGSYCTGNSQEQTACDNTGVSCPGGNSGGNSGNSGGSSSGGNPFGSINVTGTAESCLVCSDQPTMTDCLNNGTFESCSSSDMGACQTIITIRQDLSHSITKRCREPITAEYEKRSEGDPFVGFEVPDKVYYYWCGTDNCNWCFKGETCDNAETCLVCDNASSMDDCQTIGSYETCTESDAGTCQTVISIDNSLQQTITKRCRNETAAVQDYVNGDPWQGLNVTNVVYYQFCGKDNCNLCLEGSNCGAVNSSSTSSAEKCLVCSNQPSMADCLANGDFDGCACSEKGTCQTIIGTNADSTTSITKKCRTPSQAAEDFDSKSDVYEGDSIPGNFYYYTCDTDNCNWCLDGTNCGVAEQCLTCTNQPTMDDCFANGHISTCTPNSSGACQTVISIGSDLSMNITKRCRSTSRALNEYRRLSDPFQGYSVPNVKYYLPCGSDACNWCLEGTDCGSYSEGTAERCLVCSNASSLADCLNQGQYETCAASDAGACQTIMSIGSDLSRTITKRCRNPTIAKYEQEIVGDPFQGYNVPDVTYYFYCDTDDCNHCYKGTDCSTADQCLVCTNATSITDCVYNGQIETCTGSDAGTCQTIVTVDDSLNQLITKRCRDVTDAVDEYDTLSDPFVGYTTPNKTYYTFCGHDECSGCLEGYNCEPLGFNGSAQNCLVCTNEASLADCYKNGQFETCSSSDAGACQTIIGVDGSLRISVTKRCRDPVVAAEEQNSLSDEFQGYDVPNEYYYFMCDTDDCNWCLEGEDCGSAGSCFVCNKEASQQDCLDNGQIENCGPNNNGSCQTTIIVKSDLSKKITKRCSSPNDAISDFNSGDTFQGYNIPGVEYNFFCDTDDCNWCEDGVSCGPFSDSLGTAESCLVCTNEESMEDCVANGAFEQCSSSNRGACQTVIAVDGDGNKAITKRCRDVMTAIDEETNLGNSFDGTYEPNEIYYNWCNADDCNWCLNGTECGSYVKPTGSAEFCWICENAASYDECMQIGYFHTCTGQEVGACQTVISVDDNLDRTFTKRCRSPATAEVERLIISSEFRGYYVADVTYYTWCDTDQCNWCMSGSSCGTYVDGICVSVFSTEDVDGGWSTWEEWTNCTKSCGKGQRSRSRLCDQPPPQNDGLVCPGAGSEVEDCYPGACTSCLTGEVLCDNGYCEAGEACDGIDDCSDGSDESSTRCSSPDDQASQNEQDLKDPFLNTYDENSSTKKKNGASNREVSVILVILSLGLFRTF